MRTFTFTTVATIAALIGSLSATPAGAQMAGSSGGGKQGGMPMVGQGMMKRGMMGPGMMGNMMQQGMHGGFGFYLNLKGKLDLSDEQVTRLSDMKYQYEMKAIQRKADVMTAKLEARKLKSSTDSDPKKVERAIHDVHAKVAEQEIAQYRARTQARGVLTAEQKAMLKDLACPMCGGMHGDGMMGGMMGGPGGMGGMMGHMQGMMQGGGKQIGGSEDAESSHEAHH